MKTTVGTHTNSNELLLTFLQAGPEQRAKIESILEGRDGASAETSSGPLLLTMVAGSRLLGCSRSSLWRMIRRGRLRKVEILPGTYRVRRADLEAIAAGRKVQ